MLKIIFTTCLAPKYDSTKVIWLKICGAQYKGNLYCRFFESLKSIFCNLQTQIISTLPLWLNHGTNMSMQVHSCIYQDAEENSTSEDSYITPYCFTERSKSSIRSVPTDYIIHDITGPEATWPLSSAASTRMSRASINAVKISSSSPDEAKRLWLNLDPRNLDPPLWTLLIWTLNSFETRKKVTSPTVKSKIKYVLQSVPSKKEKRKPNR